MRKVYKLIDRNLIRHFGKIAVTLDTTIGERFIREGKARLEMSGGERKSLHGPPSNKMVFRPPEEKAFDEIGEDKIRYPGPKDKLFSHIAK